MRLFITRFFESLTLFRLESTPTDLGHRLSNLQNVPLILSRGVITIAEVETLFKM